MLRGIFLGFRKLVLLEAAISQCLGTHARLACLPAYLPGCLLTCFLGCLVSFLLASLLPPRFLASLIPCFLASSLPAVLAPLLPCSLAPLLPCSLASLLPCFLASSLPSSLLPCSLAPLLPCSLAPLLPCFLASSLLASLLPCSLASLLPCFLAPLLPRSLASLLHCFLVPCFPSSLLGCLLRFLAWWAGGQAGWLVGMGAFSAGRIEAWNGFQQAWMAQEGKCMAGSWQTWALRPLAQWPHFAMTAMNANEYKWRTPAHCRSSLRLLLARGHCAAVAHLASKRKSTDFRARHLPHCLPKNQATSNQPGSQPIRSRAPITRERANATSDQAESNLLLSQPTNQPVNHSHNQPRNKPAGSQQAQVNNSASHTHRIVHSLAPHQPTPDQPPPPPPRPRTHLNPHPHPPAPTPIHTPHLCTNTRTAPLALQQPVTEQQVRKVVQAHKPEATLFCSFGPVCFRLGNPKNPLLFGTTISRQTRFIPCTLASPFKGQEAANQSKCMVDTAGGWFDMRVWSAFILCRRCGRISHCESWELDGSGSQLVCSDGTQTEACRLGLKKGPFSVRLVLPVEQGPWRGPRIPSPTALQDSSDVAAASCSQMARDPGSVHSRAFLQKRVLIPQLLTDCQATV